MSKIQTDAMRAVANEKGITSSRRDRVNIVTCSWQRCMQESYPVMSPDESGSRCITTNCSAKSTVRVSEQERQ